MPHRVDLIFYIGHSAEHYGPLCLHHSRSAQMYIEQRD